MACLDAIFRRLRPGHSSAVFMCPKSRQSDIQLDKDREDIVRKVVNLVLEHIDSSYKTNPVLIQHTKMEIEKYIDVRVTQRFAEQVELHGLRQKFDMIADEDLAQVRAIQAARKKTGRKPEKHVDLTGTREEIPLVEEYIDDLNISEDNMTASKKNRSVFKNVFKGLSKRGKHSTSKKPSFVRRLASKVSTV